MGRGVDIVWRHAAMLTCTPIHCRNTIYVCFPFCVVNSSWVNGSETLYRQEKEKYQADSPVFGGTGRVHDRKVSASERRHREHDELRYSIRSIFKYLNGGFSAIRILASDFFDGRNWVGQVPHWLDMEAARKHGVSLLFTSEIYGEKRTELPVFSSLAIESQFYNVPSSGPNHDVMLYFNDDMFLASEHTVSDFWNPIIGVNVQIDPRVWVPNYHATVDEIQRDWNSEWPALRYSNWILSITLLLNCTYSRSTFRMATTIVRRSPRQSPLPTNPERGPP